MPKLQITKPGDLIGGSSVPMFSVTTVGVAPPQAVDYSFVERPEALNMVFV